MADGNFNDPIASAMQGFQTGTDWALKKQEIEVRKQQAAQQAQEFQQRKAQYEVQLGQMFTDDLGNLSLLETNSPYYKQQKKLIESKWQNIGRPVDPSYFAVLEDPNYKNTAIQAIQALQTESDPQKSAQLFQQVAGAMGAKNALQYFNAALAGQQAEREKQISALGQAAANATKLKGALAMQEIQQQKLGERQDKQIAATEKLQKQNLDFQRWREEYRAKHGVAKTYQIDRNVANFRSNFNSVKKQYGDMVNFAGVTNEILNAELPSVAIENSEILKTWTKILEGGRMTDKDVEIASGVDQRGIIDRVRGQWRLWSGGGSMSPAEKESMIKGIQLIGKAYNYKLFSAVAPQYRQLMSQGVPPEFLVMPDEMDQINEAYQTSLKRQAQAKKGKSSVSKTAEGGLPADSYKKLAMSLKGKTKEQKRQVLDALSSRGYNLSQSQRKALGL